MRLLIWILIGYILYLMFRKTRAKVEERKKVVPEEETYLDPVCGVYVSEGDAVIGRHEGKRIYFCSKECLEKYRVRLESGNS